MIILNLEIIFLLGFICVPISWLVPRAYAFDAVSFWTFVCLVSFSLATALWLLSIALLLPWILSRVTRNKGLLTIITTLALIAGLSASRFIPGWAWIGGAFFTLRALHVIFEWWMGRIVALSYRDSLHYFFFLPVLAAGPINRQPHFQRQLHRRRWEAKPFFEGAERILLGLVFLYIFAEKILSRVAIELAQATVNLANFWQVWAASVVYWVELFFVFSGATHIALGLSLMVGLKLEENFNRPWAAKNLIQFWTRWHISLTSWVQDYIFRPVSALSRQPWLAVFFSLLVIGLWHEFSIYYLLWAFWQSLGIIFSRVLIKFTSNLNLPNWLGMIGGPLFVLGWLSASRPVIEFILGDLL